MQLNLEHLFTDTLIIGAGAAGIRAALAASAAGSQVILLTDGGAAESGSSFSTVTKGWGIQALIGAERTEKNLEVFYEEIVRTGLGKCDLSLVRILVEESGSRVEDLLSYGIRFKKNSLGDYLRLKGCFSQCKRALITEDFENLKQSFRCALRRAKVKIVSATAVDLITTDGQCWGCWAVSDTLDLLSIAAKSTVMATGGGAGIFADHLVNDPQCGDGYRLAQAAGAKLTNMEFIQFMLGLKKKPNPQFLPPAALQSPGSLMESQGQDLLEKYIPDSKTRRKAVESRLLHFPFSCRDSSYRIDHAIVEERNQNRPVAWLDEKTKALTEVVHLAHAFNGGIRIDEEAATSLPGLFAAGEVAAGPHGADRIGGCMMTATQVFGARAGKNAADRSRRILKIPEAKPAPETLRKMDACCRTALPIDEWIADARRMISENLMVIRKENNLKRCRRNLEKIESEIENCTSIHPRQLKSCLRLKSLVAAGRLVSKAAIENNGSAGSHYRADLPPKCHEESPSLSPP